MAEERKSFEDSIRQLEQLVGEMESGQLPLEEMMKRFEEGRKLVAACSAELESVRQRVEKVVSAPNEPPKVEPLDLNKQL